jgi:hypothetical protein
VTAAPIALKVTTLALLEVPSNTEPKERADELTLSPAPVPERFAVASAVEPLLKDRVPEELPAELGLNVTDNEALCPDAIVTGKVMPLNPKPLPVNVSDVIVTLPPVALRVAV